MKKLGFKYEVRKKAYYVDGHERPATVEYQKLLYNDTSYDRRAHCWIKISPEGSTELEQKGLIPVDSGYHYRDDNHNDWMSIMLILPIFSKTE
jgi:hypothetical protein